VTSYLVMEKCPLDDMGIAIISFWFRVDAAVDFNAGEDKFPKEWVTKSISAVLEKDQVAFGGGSYTREINDFGVDYRPAHIWCYPFPGPHHDDFYIDEPPPTWKDKMVPLITFGDDKQEFKRAQWKLKTLNSIWVYGNGGRPQALMSQYPEEAKKDDSANGGTGGSGGAGGSGGGGDGGVAIGGGAGGAATPTIYVPPSCIGIYKGKLRVILQTNGHAKYKGCAWAQSKSETIHISTPISCQNVLTNPHPCSEPEGWVDFSAKQSIQPNQFTGYNFWYDDVSDVECGQHPETFIMDSDVQVADGKWHHVILSFDFTGAAAAPKDGPPGLPPGGNGGGTGNGGPPPVRDTGGTGNGGAPGDGGVPLTGTTDPTGGEGGMIKASATGPDGERPPLPGTWGQYSGIDGEYALAPLHCLPDNVGPDGYTYEQLACYGAPFETNGEHQPADGGKLESKCRAWLAIDDVSLKKDKLHHKDAWQEMLDRLAKLKNGDAVLSGLDDHAIVPVNALLIPGAEIRGDMATNNTKWERNYRTILGSFNGPAARIDPTSEPRQQDYERPSYEFKPDPLPVSGKPFAIPAGKSWGEKPDRNYDIKMAELFIWTGQSLDLDKDDNRHMFIDVADEKTGLLGPVGPKKAIDKLGKPNLMLHWATNWLAGNNTGTTGVKETGDGSGTDKKTEKVPEGQFVKTGDAIDRFFPDPGDPEPKQ
jgi:hypothetical protein